MSFRASRPPFYEQDPRRQVQMVDDFAGGATGATHIGCLGWQQGTIAGGGGSYSFQSVSTTAEMGVLQLLTAGGAGDQAYLAVRDQKSVLGFALGARLKWKFKLSSVDQIDAFFGAAEDAAVDYRVGGGDPLLGFRLDRAVDANLYAVLKDGVGAPNETTYSLGTADTDWHVAELVRTADGIAVYLDGLLITVITDLSHLPAVAMRLKAGVGGIAAVAKSIDFDYACYWAPVVRA